MYIMKKYFKLCPVRHVISFISAAVILLYFILRGNKSLMVKISEGFVRKYHRALSVFNSHIGASVAEILYAVVIILVLAYLIYQIVKLITSPGKGKRAAKTAITLITAALFIYAGFCVLWGVYYYADDFTEKAGLERRDITVDELTRVTRYFAAECNKYGDMVSRDERGICNISKNALIERSAGIYENTEKEFPCLVSDDLNVKPMFFSKIMSYLEFTGFFFPFTGEANVNVDSPPAMLPSTIAHELSHQRGVAKEEEANFVAVLACMKSGDVDFCYSGALLAYINLGNALYSADNEAWSEIFDTLSDNVLIDFIYDNQYWEHYDTPVADAANTVYEGFLQSYGNELGMKSYGACVDFIVNYYIENEIA